MPNVASSDYAITFACYNGLAYTKLCLESLRASDVDMTRVVAVDNSSTDGTVEFLRGYPEIHVIFNSENMGCGVAWNQGILLLQSEWTVIMNNDVIVPSSFIRPLIEAAQSSKFIALSPAMIEGSLDYDFQSNAKTWATEMRTYSRVDYAHLVCLMVRKSVFNNHGYFFPSPKLVGFEDTLFFNELRKGGIRLGTTGGVWVHHFGSITQSIMKRERGLKNTDSLGSPRNKHLIHESIFARKWRKYRSERVIKTHENIEISRYSRSVHGQFSDGAFIWKRHQVKSIFASPQLTLPVDKVYVLTVKTFVDRIQYIRAQLSVQNIPFEFIYDYDAEDITPAEQDQFSDNYQLTSAHQSITLKHIKAWKNCIEHGYSRILILEDDVLLKSNFITRLTFYLKQLRGIDSFLLFLGGADTRVSIRELLFGQPIFKRAIRTADAYVTDLIACRKRIHWLESNRISKPADHLLVEIDKSVGNTQYWTASYLVEQGSVFGLFDSTLDTFRIKHSRLFNRARYLFRKIKNRVIWVRLRRLLWIDRFHQRSELL
jgi:GT2 family glycosyltransferase/GR25 family glycosyltransferase involved in LPS biosynthesis